MPRLLVGTRKLVIILRRQGFMPLDIADRLKQEGIKVSDKINCNHSPRSNKAGSVVGASIGHTPPTFSEPNSCILTRL